MLYFRGEGYIVQKPLGTYGKVGEDKPGVDDVAAWKSPVINELRKFGFIERGCHISELACLRWLGKVAHSGEGFGDDVTKNEIVLTEVEPSKGKGISDKNHGVNQLLRAKQEEIAKKLFVCFPFVNEDVEKIKEEIRNKNKPAVGAILFDDKGVYIQDSETFPDGKADLKIAEYEANLKKALLNNFYFDEIAEMIRELNVDTENRGVGEVLVDFQNKVETGYILEKLNRVSVVA